MPKKVPISKDFLNFWVFACRMANTPNFEHFGKIDPCLRVFPLKSGPSLSLSLSHIVYTYTGVVLMRACHRVLSAAILLATVVLVPVMSFMSLSQLAAGLPLLRLFSTMPSMIVFSKQLCLITCPK